MPYDQRKSQKMFKKSGVKLKYFTKIIKVVKKEGVYSLLSKIKQHLILRYLPYFDFRFDQIYEVDTCGVMF